MPKIKEYGFSKREKQIMDYIYQKGSASAKEVLENIYDPPSNSAIRTLLRILVDKGHLKYEKIGIKYIFSASKSVTKVKKNAFKELLNTYYKNSMQEAFLTLIDVNKKTITENDLDELENLISDIKKKGVENL